MDEAKKATALTRGRLESFESREESTEGVGGWTLTGGEEEEVDIVQRRRLITRRSNPLFCNSTRGVTILVKRQGVLQWEEKGRSCEKVEVNCD